jgi:hypothetical protein
MLRLLLVVIGLFFSCGNPFNDSLVGKKLYILDVNSVTPRISGIRVPLSEVKEIGMFFKNSTEVEIFATASYGFNLGRILTVTPNLYNYTYHNGILNILELGTGDVKLRDSGDYFSSDDGTAFYKKSILELSENEKKARLNKVLNYPQNIETSYLDKEVVYKRSNDSD